MCHRLNIAAAAILALLACSSPLHAQATSPAPTKNSAQDLTGIWRRSQRPPDNTRKYTVFELAMSLTSTEPPMTPWGLAKYKAAKPNLGPHAVSLAETNDPVSQCFPPGVPRIYFQRLGPVEIIQTPGRVLMFFEYDHFVRQIYTDGRKHPEDPLPTWMGDAIGTWQGNTLVVDTVGFNDKTWLDLVGHPHSEQLHLVERIRRPSHDAMGIDFTIEDPKAYTKPWTSHKNFELKPDWNVAEIICADDINFTNLQKLTEPGK